MSQVISSHFGVIIINAIMPKWPSAFWSGLGCTCVQNTGKFKSSHINQWRYGAISNALIKVLGVVSKTFGVQRKPLQYTGERFYYWCNILK